MNTPRSRSAGSEGGYSHAELKMGTVKHVSFLELLRRHWLVLAVGYVFAFLNPFGINSKTSQTISDAFDRMYSHIYTSELAGSASADLVDVILIDDLSIYTLSKNEYGYLRANDWPLAYSDYGVIIGALRRHGYGTVILDITFYRERKLGGQTDKSFQNLIDRLAYLRDNVGLNVILGAGDDPDELEPSIEPLIAAVTSLGLTGWKGYGDNYPLYLVSGDKNDIFTLARAGFEAHCRQEGCEGLSGTEQGWLVPEASGMHISWGQPAQRVADSLGCELGGDPGIGLIDILGNVVRDVYRNAFGAESVGTEGRRACPPIPTALLSDVFCTKPACDKFFSTGGPPGKKIAMVGVSLPSARDLFDPPITGSLPGVYLHAEALRNLLLFGPDEYLKPLGLEPNLGVFGMPSLYLPVDVILAWPLLLWFVLYCVRRFAYWRWGWEKTSNWPELAIEIGELALVVALLCLIYSVALVWHRTPGFIAELVAFLPWLWVAIRNERKEIENEQNTFALAACTPEQLAIGRNAGN